MINQKGRLTASILITLVFGFLLWRLVDLAALGDTLRNIDWIWFSVANLVFLVYLALRGARIRLLAGGTGGQGLFFVTQCARAVVNNILPAGLGEVAFLYILRRIHGTDYYRGTVSLLLARYFDLAFFALAFAIVSIFLTRELPGPISTGLLVVAALLAAVPLAVILLWRAQNMGRGWKYLERFNTILERLFTALRGAHERRIYPGTLGLTAAMWLALYFHYTATIRALGYGLGAVEILWVYVFVFPLNLLPFKGIANLGSYEAAWFLALTIIGMGSTEAANLAFASHIIFFGIVAVTAVIPSLAWLSAPKSR